MQSNEIKKKLESKIAQIQRRIDEKEFEKSRKKQESKEKRLIRETTKADDIKLTSTRNEIKNEIANINSELKREKDEMNRLNAELLYRTRNEYEDMIKRYEREMQFNHQLFRPNEEARILREISNLKKGINKLDDYEKKKQDVNTLQEKLQVKCAQRDQNWSQHQQNKDRIYQIEKELKELKEIIQINDKDLPDMINLRNELKKQLEDLNREINAKHQQIKKESLENKKRNKALKQDEVFISMEDTLRDLNKLINYYQKLVDSVPFNECSNQQQQQRIKSLTDSSSSSSLNASTNLSDLFKPKKLSLNLLELNSSYSLNEQVSNPSSSVSSPISSTLNTPTSSSSISCDQQGSFLIRKSFEDQNRTKKQLKKLKQNKNNNNNNKLIHHSVDIINLLVKMNVPINLSSQLDECLKELNIRKESVLNQISIYESTNRLTAQQREEQNNFELNSLDSNYESDNNSVKSFQSSSLLINDNNKNQIINNFDNLEVEAALTIQVKLNNSDDSDSTLNESLTNSNENNSTNTNNNNNNISLKSSINKIAKIKISNDSPSIILNTMSSSSSDSTATPGSPKTPISFHTDNNNTNNKNSNKTKENSNQEESLPSNTNTNTIATTTPTVAEPSAINQDLLNFKRQLSDGYSSSNTPLSASSINNETPSCNPFFSSTQNNL